MGVFAKLRSVVRPGVVRLADGTPARMGQRVVLVREACERDGRTWDDRVYTITWVHDDVWPLPGETDGMLDVGPRQVWASMCRLAPRGRRGEPELYTPMLLCPHLACGETWTPGRIVGDVACRSCGVEMTLETARGVAWRDRR